MKRLLLLLLALVLFGAGIWSPAKAQASSHRYVMFLAGLCPWPGSDPHCNGQISAEARARATFRTLIAAMNAAHLAYKPLYYSYDPAHSTYTVIQTHQSLDQSAAALAAEIRAVQSRDPGASFVLVGHSLGGVTAARWAAGHGKNPADTIITFDSPLRGIQGGSELVSIGGVFGGPIWKSLQPGSSAIRAITSHPNSWWKHTGHLHTIANRADVLVPPSESLLGYSHTVADTSCPVDLFLVRTCHGAVLSDAALNTWVVTHWMRSLVPPTPTPSPAPTAVPPLPTPTSTLPPPPASTPLPTATP